MLGASAHLDRETGAPKVERRGGVKKVGTGTQSYSDRALARPKDNFFPLSRYERKYGDPEAPRNRGLKHKIVVVDGINGVVVPGDDGEMPWALEHRFGSRHELDKEGCRIVRRRRGAG